MTHRIIQSLVLSSILLTSSVADETDNVTAATQAWFAALNAQDVATLVPYYHAEETSFGGLGDLLTEGFHTEEAMAALFAAGFKTDLQWRHMKVQVFGDAAVVTGYLAGAATLPGGEVVADTWRTSVMWVRDEGAWKVVHFHASPLLPD